MVSQGPLVCIHATVSPGIIGSISNQSGGSYIGVAKDLIGCLIEAWVMLGVCCGIYRDR